MISKHTLFFEKAIEKQLSSFGSRPEESTFANRSKDFQRLEETRTKHIFLVT